LTVLKKQLLCILIKEADMLAQLFKTKPLSQLMDEAHSEHGLRRALTSWNLVLLGIGAIIGTGIFVLLGKVAAENAGPAVILSIIISGIGCVFAGLCYAEFASMIPVAGSAYTYAYATMGEFIAWLIGWNLILEYLFASATVAVGWSKYLLSFINDFGIHLPQTFTYAPIDRSVDGFYLTGSIVNIPAILIIVLITVLLTLGIKESVKFNNIIVAVKIAALLLFIGFGLFYIDPANWKPFIPANEGNFGSFGFTGILTGAGIIFFAYIGFDAVSTAAQEAKDPQRDMPRGILGSLLICTVLYIVVAAVLTGMVSYKEFYHDPAPIASAIDKVSLHSGWFISMLKSIIKIGALAGMSSVILVMLMGQPRIFYTMSVDGLLPGTFKKVHHKYKTPYISTLITGTAALIIAGLLPIGILGELVSIGTLFAFVIVCGGILVLRRTQPDTHRPFKTPFVPWVPIAGMVICLAQMVALPFDTWLRLIIWIIIGLIIYFAYGIKNSKLAVTK
jgi:basic amino acid/polyamine antiporter, APA family